MTPFELDHFTGYSTNAEYEAEIREQQERNKWHEVYQSLVIKIFPDWRKDAPETHLWELWTSTKLVDHGYGSTFEDACNSAKLSAYDYADLVAKGE